MTHPLSTLLMFFSHSFMFMHVLTLYIFKWLTLTPPFLCSFLIHSCTCMYSQFIIILRTLYPPLFGSFLFHSCTCMYSQFIIILQTLYPPFFGSFLFHSCSCMYSHYTYLNDSPSLHPSDVHFSFIHVHACTHNS